MNNEKKVGLLIAVGSLILCLGGVAYADGDPLAVVITFAKEILNLIVGG